MSFLGSFLEVFGKLVSPATMPLRASVKALPGLAAPVELFRDAHGAPHLYAQSEDDLFFAQGYLVGRDRLFQLLLLQSVGRGRLAELLGDRPLDSPQVTAYLAGRTLVDFDLMMRAFGLGRSADASFARLSPAGRRTCERYAAGVNAAGEEASKRKPLELRLLKASPPRWEPADCALATRLIAFDLNYAWRMILTLGSLAERVSPEVLKALTPRWPEGAPSITSAGSPAGAAATSQLAALEAAGRHALGFDGRSKGSNNWAVGASRTTTGGALLCNDPHLKLGAPSIWYEIHLCAGDLDVAGVSVPGLPGVGLGHNRDIAWGATAGLADDTDFYVERVCADDPFSYETESGPRRFEAWEETIRVKGKPDVVRTLRATRHGPVLSDVLAEPAHAGASPDRSLLAEAAGAARAGAPREVLAMRWTAHEPTVEVDAALAVARAHDFESFRSAVKLHGAPTFNFVYADALGHVGYQLGGLVPRRRGFMGHTPLPGHDGSKEWDGFVPYEELPSAYDPPAGYVATANNPPADASYPHYLSIYWEPDHRITRIHERFAEKERFGADDMESMQADRLSLHARRIIDRMLRPVAARREVADEVARAALARLLAWDCVSEADSPEAAFFHVFSQRLVEDVFAPVLGAGLLRAYLEVSNEIVFPLEGELAAAATGRPTPLLAGRDLDALVEGALTRSAAELRARFGAFERWRWGPLHRTYVRHPLHDVKALRGLLSMGPFERGGDGMTLDNGSWLFTAPFEHWVGASCRMVWNAADWDASRIIIAGGSSGNPFSRHYRDQAPLWSRNEYRAAPFTRAAVEAACTRTELRPPG